MVQKLIIPAIMCWFSCIIAERPTLVRNTNKLIFEDERVNYRLPNNTKPESYTVSLVTDVADGVFEFSGEVSILIHVLENTNSITVHQRELRNISAELRDAEGRKISLLKPSYDETTECLTFETIKDELAAGSKVTLQITYEGTLSRDDTGFYRSFYKNSQRKTVYEINPSFIHRITQVNHDFIESLFELLLIAVNKYLCMSHLQLAGKHTI